MHGVRQVYVTLPPSLFWGEDDCVSSLIQTPVLAPTVSDHCWRHLTQQVVIMIIAEDLDTGDGSCPLPLPAAANWQKAAARGHAWSQTFLASQFRELRLDATIRDTATAWWDHRIRRNPQHPNLKTTTSKDGRRGRGTAAGGIRPVSPAKGCRRLLHQHPAERDGISTPPLPQTIEVPHTNTTRNRKTSRRRRSISGAPI